VAVDEALDLTAKTVDVILSDGIATAMNRFNRKNKPDEPAEEGK
jgi:hypothetical protein